MTIAGISSRFAKSFGKLATAILHRLDRVGDLDQLAGGFFGSAYARSTANFIRPFSVRSGVRPRQFDWIVKLLIP